MYSFLVYDIVYGMFSFAEEWKSLPKLVTPVFSAAMCGCNGAIYVIKHSIQCFKADTQQWSTVELPVPLPFEIGIQCAVTAGKRLYIIGSYIFKLLEFDTSGNKLTTLGEYRNVSGLGCVHNNKIYVFGGEDTGVLEFYDLQLKKFSFVHKIIGSKCMLDSDVLTVPVFPRFR